MEGSYQSSGSASPLQRVLACSVAIISELVHANKCMNMRELKLVSAFIAHLCM